MWHEAGDVAFAIADAGDVVHGAVWITGSVVGSLRSGVVKENLTVFLQLGERGIVDVIVAVAVSDGNLEDLALGGGAGEWRVGFFDANMHVPADKAQTGIAHHSAREQTCLAQNLETVAYAENHAATLGEFFDRLHDRRKTGNGTGAQIVAVGKSAGQNDGVAASQVLRLVPD